MKYLFSLLMALVVFGSPMFAEHTVVTNERRHHSPCFRGEDVPEYNAFKGGFQWAAWEKKHAQEWLVSQGYNPADYPGFPEEYKPGQEQRDRERGKF